MRTSLTAVAVLAAFPAALTGAAALHHLTVLLRERRDPPVPVTVAPPSDATRQAADRVAAALGPALPAARAGVLVAPPAPPVAAADRPRLLVHYCLFDRDCRSFDAPARLQVTTRAGTLALAPPFAAFAGQRSWRRYLTLTLDERYRCRNVVALLERDGVTVGYRCCQRRVGHRGGCRDPQTGVKVTRPRTLPR